ncbi:MULTISPECIES: aromatic ring-hydroxylating oxygenase subunit alpha [Maritimibacter]|uniref:Rieske domain-containing protein n=1 Tax=Maritimibacter alkaliphilus HTCC2654 TaxID=314271 RepID=A3VK90_9RHOB|nr:MULTISPECIES: aromatic ring-hydroxylating dioxygenase subunit alpha [Maritimibacter]EAQ11395.1 hypothetical protein RB2654_23573 [Rhodobacterales bacterium HTCC2654] [Maritimibacter alkaliphilus HTCC2654]MBL6430022.1 aromatic ring-hydroxylating dioxygenase subunit alpha [Maritimibacter sp.]TYP80101.1 Rieske-like 2Fe-2S protein [Maritimibacter alkaliphilus HTCC2654]
MTIQRVKPGDFTKTPVDKTEDPDFGTEMIPKERYTSRDFMQKEWDRLWTKVWNWGCASQDIEEPGDYIVTSLGKEEILLTRQPDGTAKGFYNVCQHRGNRLMMGQGNATTFKCNYHHWEYKLTGEFENIPDIETFPQGAPPCGGLTEVRVEEWNGFVFFCLDPDGESFDDFIHPLKEHLGPYHFDRMVKVTDWTVEWECNWKTSVDAFNESYHVQGIHPELLYFIEDKHLQIDTYEKHNRYLIPFATISHRVNETTEIPHLIKHAMKEAGMDPADFDGRISEIRPALQKWKREHGAEQGLDYSDLNDEQLTDDYHYMIFPNITMNTHADDLMLFRQRPHETDPDKMYFDVQMFKLLKKDEEKPRRKPKNERFKHGERSMGLVIDQDAANLPGVQRGMHSEAYEGLWLGDQELRIRHFHKVLMDYVGED